MLYSGCLMPLKEAFLLETIHIKPHKLLWLNALWKSLSVFTGLLRGSCLLIYSGTKPWLSPSIPAMVNIVGTFISSLELYSCPLQLSSSARDCSTRRSKAVVLGMKSFWNSRYGKLLQGYIAFLFESCKYPQQVDSKLQLIHLREEMSSRGAWGMGLCKLRRVQRGQVQGPVHGLGKSPVSELQNDWVESSPEEKGLGILVGDILYVSWQCVLVVQKAKHVLGCTKRNMTSRWFCCAPVRAHLESPPPLCPTLRSSA